MLFNYLKNWIYLLLDIWKEKRKNEMSKLYNRWSFGWGSKLSLKLRIIQIKKNEIRFKIICGNWWK